MQEVTSPPENASTIGNVPHCYRHCLHDFRPGCCIWDKKEAKCFFCGDLKHDPGCGGDGVGFVKNAKGIYVKLKKGVGTKEAEDDEDEDKHKIVEDAEGEEDDEAEDDEAEGDGEDEL